MAEVETQRCGPVHYGLNDVPVLNFDLARVREEILYAGLTGSKKSAELADQNELQTIVFTPPLNSEIENVFVVCDSELKQVFVHYSELLSAIKTVLEDLKQRIDVTGLGYVDIQSYNSLRNKFTTTNLDFCDEFHTYKLSCLKIRDMLSEIASIHNENIDKIKKFLTFYQNSTNPMLLSIPLSEYEEPDLYSAFIKQSKHFKQPETSILISATDSLIVKIAQLSQQCPNSNEHGPSVHKSTRAFLFLDTLFLFLFLITSVLFLSLSFMNIKTTAKWTVAFRLFRGPLFTLAFIYLIVVNIIGWTKSRVKYVKIFDFGRPGKVPTLRFLLNICNVFSVFLFVVAIFYTLCVQLSWNFYFVKGMAMILWGLYLAFMLNPVFIWYKSSRWAFARVLLRIVTSPAHTVYFGDFWIADQLNSLVVILLDFQYFFCYCFIEFNSSLTGDSCSSHSSFIRPAIACFPALWRLLQCLRNFRDTNDFSHFLNGIKYVTTFPVVILAALLSRTQDNMGVEHLYENVFLYIWAVAGIIHALYTFLWDVLRDWGVKEGVGWIGIRKERVYKFKLYYYLAIIVDFVLRFSFIIKLSLSIQTRIDADLLYTILAFGEMFRRFIWNFFRLEWEQIRTSD